MQFEFCFVVFDSLYVDLNQICFLMLVIKVVDLLDLINHGDQRYAVVVHNFVRFAVKSKVLYRQIAAEHDEAFSGRSGIHHVGVFQFSRHEVDEIVHLPHVVHVAVGFEVIGAYALHTAKIAQYEKCVVLVFHRYSQTTTVEFVATPMTRIIAFNGQRLVGVL